MRNENNVYGCPAAGRKYKCVHTLFYYVHYTPSFIIHTFAKFSYVSFSSTYFAVFVLFNYHSSLYNNSGK